MILVKVILIDDEQPALDYLEYQLKNVSDFKVIGKYTNPLEGKQAIEEGTVDLVFLDIQIPDLNGIELAEQLLEKKPDLPIVFITAYDEYAIKAFELNAIDYVLKPVSASRLLTTVKRIEQEVKEKVAKQFSDTGRLALHLFQQVSLTDCSQGQENPILLKWRTANTEQLFLYLVQHESREVNKNFLIELLWPDLEPEKAYKQLYTSIYNIRKTLGLYRDHIHIKSISDGYMLIFEDVDIDVKQFETFVDEASPLSEKTVADYERTLAIFTGDYLETYDYIWAEGVRHRLRLKWIHTALQVVRWYYEKSEFPPALALSQEVLMRYPLEEEAHFFAMKIYDAMEDFSDVRRQYEKLQELLLEELQVAPKPTITAWYTNWEDSRCPLMRDKT